MFGKALHLRGLRHIDEVGYHTAPVRLSSLTTDVERITLNVSERDPHALNARQISQARDREPLAAPVIAATLFAKLFMRA